MTVLPNRDALYTLSLTPVGEKPSAAQAAAEDTASSQAEWRWLVRHKRRSVLETSGPELPETDARHGSPSTRRLRSPWERSTAASSWPRPAARAAASPLRAASGCQREWARCSSRVD